MPVARATARPKYSTSGSCTVRLPTETPEATRAPMRGTQGVTVPVGQGAAADRDPGVDPGPDPRHAGDHVPVGVGQYVDRVLLAGQVALHDQPVGAFHGVQLCGRA